jgi:multidrug efflux system outer membrane protein
VRKNNMKTALLVSMMSLTMAGCASFQDYLPPEPSEAVSQTTLTDADYQFASEQTPVSAWWKEFDDVQLTQLVEQALKTNLDVRVAYANLLQARAISTALNSDRTPTLNANGGYNRNLFSEEYPSSSVRANDQYSAGFDSTWELDLFGRVSNRIQAQLEQEQAIGADLQQIYVTVAAEVARNYFELRGAQYRLDIAERNAKNQGETYELTENMLSAGSASALDVSRAKTQLSLTRSLIPPLKAQVTAAINRLSVLTGQVPNTLQTELAESKALPSLPVTVAVGNAQDLLKRRPDIRSAERLLASSVSSYNIAVSDLFPSVNLVGSIGFLSTNLSTFGTSALAGSIGPSLSWQLFDRNRLYAQIDQADASSITAMAQYEKTVLSALEETQTALSDFSHEEQRRAELQEAAASAQQSVKMAKDRFDFGYDNFLDVLDAERTLLEAEDSLANSEIEAGLDLISIYKALGGGWEVAPEPTLPEQTYMTDSDK